MDRSLLRRLDHKAAEPGDASRQQGAAAEEDLEQIHPGDCQDNRGRARRSGDDNPGDDEKELRGHRVEGFKRRERNGRRGFLNGPMHCCQHSNGPSVVQHADRHHDQRRQRKRKP